MVQRKEFTEEEKQFILKNKSAMFYNQIATILNRSQPAIRRFCHKIEQVEQVEQVEQEESVESREKK